MLVSVAMVMLTVGATASASARGTNALAMSPTGHLIVVVSPNGHDDTADIQAAFNTCMSYRGWCTVQLVEGTYHTAQITVTGFKGSFVGAGQGSTIIEGLPNMASPTADPFWTALPGEKNPWPVMFTFVNGAFSISGMTITDTNVYPTLGWDYPEVGTMRALWSWITITGTQAYVSIDHLTALGGRGDQAIPLGNPDRFNTINGIDFQGMLLPSPWSDSWADQLPLTGVFVMTNSVADWAVRALYFENLLNATVMVRSNSIESTPFSGFEDISDSRLVYVGNVFTNIMYSAAIFGWQSVDKSDLLPSTVYVLDNYFGVNYQGGGLSFFDNGQRFYGVASTLTAVVTGNAVVTNDSCDCYTEAFVGMISYSLVSAAFSRNVLIGGGGGIAVDNIDAAPNTGRVVISGNTVRGAVVGIDLYTANGDHVTDNVVKNSGAYGIVVWHASSNNVVAHNFVKGSAKYDLYWDGTGTGNQWVGNVCATSSPPGLC
jgi:parallel beta-helix repeat protein